MSVGLTNSLLTTMGAVVRALLVVTLLCHVTSVNGMEAELVSCDGSGLHVMMHGVDESVYHGKPYVQGDCSDINCGQGGDSWTRDVIGNNVTWHLHLSMQMLQNYDHCSTLVRNLTHYYYMAKLVMPRMNEPIELKSDHMVEVRCHIHDMITMNPSVNPINSIQVLHRVDDLITGQVETPSVGAVIVRASDDQIPTTSVLLGERLKLQVRFLADLGEFWSQIRVLHFEAWNSAKTEHFFIVKDCCPTEEGYYINVGSTEDHEPVTEIEFDAFRFKEQEDVLFTLTVRVCKGHSTDMCRFTCSARGKRSALTDGSSRAKRNAQDLISARSKDLSLSHVEMATMLRTRVQLPNEEIEEVVVEYEETYVDLNDLKRMDSGADTELLMHTNDVDRDDSKPEIELRSSSEPTGVCLDMIQLYVVCALLILVLLIAGCGTGYYSYKLVQHRFVRRGENYGHLSMLARRGSVERKCRCKQALIGQRCTCDRCDVIDFSSETS